MPSLLTLPAAVTTKLAAGDVQTFENSLATIGRSYLSPKAPGLFAHEIGFQVLDQDDDNSRAVGVFGFRIGKKLYYVPMFYRNGTVKGTEQLRDPKRKRTVPLSDAWVNKLLSERGDDPPERVPRGQQKGVALPSLWQLKYPPTKYAAAGLTPADVDLIKRDLATVITGPVPGEKIAAADDLDLIKVAAEHPAVMAGLNRLVADFPWFGEALARFHGTTKLAAALDAATATLTRRPLSLLDSPKPLVGPTKAAAPTLSVVRVRAVDLGRGPGLGGIDHSPADLAELHAGRNAYRDARKEAAVGKVTAWVGGTPAGTERYHNPTESGFYEVLGEDHEFHPCVVLAQLIGWLPEANNKVLVIQPSDGAWVLAHRNNVWVRNRDAALVPDRESGKHGALHAWVEGLKAVKDKIPEGRHAAVVLLSPGRVTATVPVDCWGEGCHTLHCPESNGPFWVPQKMRELNPQEDPRAGSTYDRRVEIFPDPGHSLPMVSGSQLYVPKGAKLVTLDGPRFKLGNGSDPERTLFSVRKKAGEHLVGVFRDGAGWVVEGPRLCPVKAAYVEDAEAVLVAYHRLRPTDARRLVEEAKTSAHASWAAVKYADEDPYPNTGLSHSSPGSPHMPFENLAMPGSFADDIMPSATGGTAAIPIDDMIASTDVRERTRPYPTAHGVKTRLLGIGNGAPGDGSSDSGDPNQGPTDDDLRAVAGAAGSGKRELFDTAGLAALVKYTRLPSLRERTRARMERTVSDLADHLAHLYWNTQEWVEQYGQTEVGPLEDQIRDQFEGLGDLLLTLQEKAVESSMDTGGLLPEAKPADGGD